MEIKKNLIILLILFFACTSNPFWDDPKTAELKLSGNITAKNNQTNVPISVWLESLDQYTITDSVGNFSISISNTQTSSGNLNGPITVYFFIYNYALDSATIYFTNGLFSKDQTDFSDSGELLNPMELEKLISAKLELQFNQNSLFNRDTVRLSVYLEPHAAISIDAYKYILHLDGSDFHSGLIFRSLSGINSPTIYRFIGQDQYGNQVSDQMWNGTYDSGQTTTWTYYLLSDSLELDSGNYEVIPYFLLQHEFIPKGLITALGGDSLFTVSSHFLKLPVDIITDTLELSF